MQYQQTAFLLPTGGFYDGNGKRTETGKAPIGGSTGTGTGQDAKAANPAAQSGGRDIGKGFTQNSVYEYRQIGGIFTRCHTK